MFTSKAAKSFSIFLRQLIARRYTRKFFQSRSLSALGCAASSECKAMNNHFLFIKPHLSAESFSIHLKTPYEHLADVKAKRKGFSRSTFVFVDLSIKFSPFKSTKPIPSPSPQPHKLFVLIRTVNHAQQTFISALHIILSTVARYTREEREIFKSSHGIFTRSMNHYSPSPWL